MNRLQAVDLFAKPCLSLLLLTRGAVPVAAGSANPVILAATVATIDHVAQLPCAAACDGAEHLLHVKRSGLLSRLQERRTVQSEAISDGGHGWCGLQRSAKETLNSFPSVGFPTNRQMQIDRGRLQAAVAEILLNHAERNSRFK